MAGAPSGAEVELTGELTVMVPPSLTGYIRRMWLEGSCQCQKVRFRVQSETPVPYMYCFCSICRKLSGSAFGCNIMGKRPTLKVTGSKHLRKYHPRIRNPGKRPVISEGERWFCELCGTHLWVMDDRWPEGMWPNVAAIDTPLPRAPEQVFMMLRYKPSWVAPSQHGAGDRFAEYPKLSIADWHAQHGLTVTAKKKRPAAKRPAAAKRRSVKARRQGTV